MTPRRCAGSGHRGFANHAGQCTGQVFGVRSVHQESRIADDFREGATVGCNHWHAKCHRLERRDPESFLEGGLHQEAGAQIQRTSSARFDVPHVAHMAGQRWSGDSIEPRLCVWRRLSGKHELRNVAYCGTTLIRQRTADPTPLPGTVLDWSSRQESLYASSSQPTFLRGSRVPKNSM